MSAQPKTDQTRSAEDAKRRPSSTARAPASRPNISRESSNVAAPGVLMVGPNFRIGKKIGCGNFGELRLGKLHSGCNNVLNCHII
jgi:hypothetical protein